MFADYVKMAVKAGLIVVVTAVIVVIFASFNIPNTPLNNFINAVATGRRIVVYYAPSMDVWLTVGFSLLALRLTILGAKVTLIAVRWIFKVNE